MIADRHNITIEEISFQEYQQAKRKQKLKPPIVEDPKTIYGIILEEISFSIGNFARQVDSSLQLFKRINRLARRTETDGKNVLDRIKVYRESGGEVEKLYSSASELERMIREGRGIDLWFKRERASSKENSEIHSYRVREENIFLVWAQIPHCALDSGEYRFTRTTNKPYSRLNATSIMPKSEIQPQFTQRRTA